MKKKLLSVIQIILILIIAYSLYNIGSYYYSRYNSGKEFDQVRDIVKETINYEENFIETPSGSGTVTAAGPSENEAELARKSLEELRKINEDIVAYIVVEGLGIEYPVVYKDNEYYLRRNLQKKYSVAGTLFVEELNKTDFTDMNTIIYGHNMSNALVKSSAMFEPLIEFVDRDYVNSKDSHIIQIFTEEGIKRYEVFSAYFTDAYYDYRTINMPGDDWVAYANKIKSNSKYDFKLGREINENDKIITLSTCDNVTHDGRMAVHAVLIDGE